mmetsp:Transcript_64679/g.210849  ORF Transcript_64679/g.210849 Transcript_64679/m.210849 type:complete len:302 (+) Transcript_64679:439-1344(+)
MPFCVVHARCRDGEFVLALSALVFRMVRKLSPAFACSDMTLLWMAPLNHPTLFRKISRTDFVATQVSSSSSQESSSRTCTTKQPPNGTSCATVLVCIESAEGWWPAATTIRHCVVTAVHFGQRGAGGTGMMKLSSRVCTVALPSLVSTHAPTSISDAPHPMVCSTTSVWEVHSLCNNSRMTAWASNPGMCASTSLDHGWSSSEMQQAVCNTSRTLLDVSGWENPDCSLLMKDCDAFTSSGPLSLSSSAGFGGPPLAHSLPKPIVRLRRLAARLRGERRRSPDDFRVTKAKQVDMALEGGAA